MGANKVERLVGAVVGCGRATVDVAHTIFCTEVLPITTVLIGGVLITPLQPIAGVSLVVSGASCACLVIADAIICSKKEEKEDNIDLEKNTDYNIFEYMDIKNKYGCLPEYLGREGKYISYSLPMGVTLKDLSSNKERIATLLKTDEVTIKLTKDKSRILIKKKDDNLPSFSPYTKCKDNDKKGLKARIGTYSDDDELSELWIDISKYYHLLIASTTGYGKSSLIRSILVDMMTTYTPDELKFYFIDMKMTELVLFEKYKHCVGKCITEHKDILPLLQILREELVNRKRLCYKEGVMNMTQYNAKDGIVKLPYIVMVIDELLEVVLGKTDDHKAIASEMAILLSQARAFGIYFILSTQHPSRKLIDSSMQSNIGQRIGLRVASQTDAEVVFDGVSVPLHTIEGKGRGYFGLNGKYIAFQSYYVGDPFKGDETDEIKKLLKPYTKSKLEVEKDNEKYVDMTECATRNNTVSLIERFKRGE